ncbi:hypothetical protein DNL40_02605 [Xylanimonas oleitrophica]|uniref:DUF222 domain-containing protein n=1 Tax=Xylanimonas oleitrophica TaxID=2607479 RepID=A0A2W5WVT2_9MICO|nr:hypothetical protein [Xylanimonas oleitrophica]PZR55280.1 hypothetical protein DNL40_02605 [Xylanimonas oleitrophica]
MTALDVGAIADRYTRALDSKPGKGPVTEKGVAALQDSVCDVPDLLAALAANHDVEAHARLAMIREYATGLLDARMVDASVTATDLLTLLNTPVEELRAEAGDDDA